MNAGFTNCDCGALLLTQLKDLDKGRLRLVYKRKKTRKRLNVPVVNYKLWPKTISLLKKARAADGKFALVTEAGTPLITDFVDESGKRHKWDTIQRNWGRLQNACKIPAKPFKYLRKTGATFVAKFDRGIEDLYLGHAPDRMSKHYVARSGEPYPALDEATEELGKAFGMMRR